MQTRGIEVSQLYTLVRDTTNLTGVQAKILDHILHPWLDIFPCRRYLSGG